MLGRGRRGCFSSPRATQFRGTFTPERVGSYLFFFLFFSVIVNESASSSSSSTRWKKRANLSSVRRRDQSRLSVSRMEREDVEHKIGTVPLDRDIPLFHFVTLLRKGAFLILFFRATSSRNTVDCLVRRDIIYGAKSGKCARSTIRRSRLSPRNVLANESPPVIAAASNSPSCFQNPKMRSTAAS